MKVNIVPQFSCACCDSHFLLHRQCLTWNGHFGTCCVTGCLRGLCLQAFITGSAMSIQRSALLQMGHLRIATALETSP